MVHAKLSVVKTMGIRNGWQKQRDGSPVYLLNRLLFHVEIRVKPYGNHDFNVKQMQVPVWPAFLGITRPHNREGWSWADQATKRSGGKRKFRESLDRRLL